MAINKSKKSKVKKPAKKANDIKTQKSKTIKPKAPIKSKKPIVNKMKKEAKPKKIANQKKVKIDKKYVEEKLTLVLQEYDKSKKGKIILNDIFIKDLKKYLDKYFSNYTLKLMEDYCLFTIEDFEIEIELEN